MPLKTKVSYPKIDMAKSEEEIHQFMVAAVTDAAKTWVIHTTDVVPVLTGASKATFLKLASKARVALSISPKTKDRIPLGIESSQGELIFEKGKLYSFLWSSDLYYIHIVDGRVNFIDAGNAAIEALNPILPSPIIVSR